MFAEWKRYIPEVIFLTPEAHFSDNHASATPYVSVHKDILIPGHVSDAKITNLLHMQRPLRQRKWLAAYKGATQGKPWREQVPLQPFCLLFLGTQM
jgi:hypothetical protein